MSTYTSPWTDPSLSGHRRSRNRHGLPPPGRLLDLSVAPGYTKVGYRLRGLSWSSAVAGSLAGKVGPGHRGELGPGRGDLRGAGSSRRARAHAGSRPRAGPGGTRADQRRASIPTHISSFSSCDLADLEAVRHFARRFAADEPRLDVLVQQRGASAGRSDSGPRTASSWRSPPTCSARSCSRACSSSPSALDITPA